MRKNMDDCKRIGHGRLRQHVTRQAVLFSYFPIDSEQQLSCINVRGYHYSLSLTTISFAVITYTVDKFGDLTL